MQAAAQGDSDRASRLCTAFAAYCSNAMLIWVSDTPQVPYPSAAFHMPSESTLVFAVIPIMQKPVSKCTAIP